MNDSSKPDEESESVSCFCSQRWILAYSAFWGFVFVYSLRVNISVAMVCMVKTDLITNGSLSNQSYFNSTRDLQCVIDEQNNPTINDHAEFDWAKTLRSSMLASFFYGYIVTQIPGGWLADKFGGKRVLGIAMLISSIATIILPVCARQSYIAVYVLRVILGLATGVSFPAVTSMWGRWAPALERSKLISLGTLGTMVGNIATFSTAGVLCENGFDNGWGSIFYITGGLAFIWVLTWFYLTADSPNTHPRISEAEKKYIISNIEYNTDNRTARVPWKSILTSRAVWACLTAHICNNWTNYTLLTSLPAFMKEALHFDIKQNGLLSSVPYIAQFVSGFVAGQTADLIRTKQLLTTTGTRRLYQTFSFLGAGAFLVATGFMSCNQRYLAVAFLSLAVMFTGLCRAGYNCNHVDFAPKYAGVLFGLTNTLATIPGMVAPIVAGALTPNQSPEEWRNVFYVCAGFDLFGALMFGFFSSGELEPWARDPDVEFEVEPDKEVDKQNVFFYTKNKDNSLDQSAENKGFEKGEDTRF